MEKYKKFNNITGWLVWAIATYVYGSTIEPTASFWDCGEYIATAFKLEVGHPPGAPLFLMIGRLFSLFAGDVSNVAMMVNMLSALSSSFTILFLFWSITHFGRKILLDNKEFTTGKALAIMGAGAVGALAYTFSDSFWFSAVEGEVYALSSLFTALVFWLILKWERVADQPYADRYLILIAYLMGLSIGVHLLNLLVIPAITFVYYFKKYKPTTNGIIYSSIISLVILMVIQYGIIQVLIKISSYFERFFVNTLGLPFNTGNLFYALIVIALTVWGIHYSIKNRKVILNTALLCFAVILIGYSSFALIVIRSSADTPMDENNPENIYTLLSYLNREQYGDRPLLHGHYFNSPLDWENNEPYKDGSPVYYQDKKEGKYKISDEKEEAVPNYNPKFTGFFPRMYSSQSNHVRAYKEWSNFEGRPVSTVDANGKRTVIKKPTFWENITFLRRYQLWHMYGRYFMWNFVGRQNDVQGHGNRFDGNVLTGIDFIDELFLGPQDNLPPRLKENKARNTFYMLPLILGIVGFLYQLMKHKTDFTIVFMLFFLTGIAIIIYLNQYPIQPRERDYAYVGSFYAFSIWIGLGVLALYEAIAAGSRSREVVAAVGATVISLVAVPGIMAKEGWDDHDRSHRYTARDFAINYLESCEPNAVLFTNGDNDTFPLWYVQEVEGIRTDVRVVNLSLLNTDWYIDQMKRKAYDSEPVPFSLTEDQYRQGTRDFVIMRNQTGKHENVKDIVDFIASDDQRTQLRMRNNDYENFAPSKKLRIPVDSAKVVEKGIVPPELAGQMVKSIDWEIEDNIIYKNKLMILDLLANFNWDRPVYFAITTGSDAYINLEPYFQLEGLAYRLVPLKTTRSGGQTGRVATDIMYDNLMNKFKWGGMEGGEIYMDENNLRMCMNLRNNFGRLADELIKEGKKEKAKEVMDKCLEVMPDHNVPFDFFMLPFVENYYLLGAMDQADTLANILLTTYDQELDYFLGLKSEALSAASNDVNRAMAVLQQLLQTTTRHKREELVTRAKDIFEKHREAYDIKVGRNR